MRERKRRFRIAIPPRHWLRFCANVKRAPAMSKSENKSESKSKRDRKREGEIEDEYENERR